MKKKLIFAFVLVAVFVMGVSAMDFGVLGRFSPYSRAYTETDGTYYWEEKESMKDWGISAFFDFGNFMVDVGYASQLSYTEEIVGVGSDDFEYTVTYVDLGLMLKFPFEMGPLSLFPMGGLAYKINLSFKDAAGVDLKAGAHDIQKKDLNQTWIKAGLGADVDLSKNLYLRIMALVGYRFKTERIRNNQDYLESSGYSTSYSGLGFDLSAGFGLRL